MKKIDNFTNVYKVSKTLKFKLIPVGKTEENFKNAKLLEIDEERAENYKKAKKIIDRYFSSFIEITLSEVKSDKFCHLVKEFSKLYYKVNRTEEEKQQLNEELPKLLQKEIESIFISYTGFNDLFKGKILDNIMNSKTITEEEYKIISSFDKFSTYFTNYLTNRKNIFMGDGKVGSIAYRCIKENLPMFLYNVKVFNEYKENLKNELKELNSNIKNISYGCNVEDVFNIDYFNLCLTGKDISIYNTIIGGIIKENGEKIPGINEYINLYNQKNKTNIPKLKQLYKQILQEGEKISFSIEKFKNDKEVYDSINGFINNKEYAIDKNFNNVIGAIKNITRNDLKRIYVNSKNISKISNEIYGNWNTIFNVFKEEYDSSNIKDIGKKKYVENKEKYFKKKSAYSISDIVVNVSKYNTESQLDFCREIELLFEKIYKEYSENKNKFIEINIKKNKIKGNKNSIEIIKNLLDSIKNFYDTTKMFFVDDLTLQCDEKFYAEIEEIQKIDDIVNLYNKVRNYVTKKPYSLDKIKLNFNNPTFLNGWDSYFNTKSALILRKENKYFLLIVNLKLNSDEVKQLYSKSSNTIEKLNYVYQKPDFKNIPRLFIRSKGEKFAPAVEKYNLPVKNIIDIYDNKYYTTSYKNINPSIFKKSLIKMIDYYKLGFSKHESYKIFKFNWKNSDTYDSIDEFYNDCITSCYELSFEVINLDVLNKYIDEGKIYLYQIYNKDFSSYAKGTKNLHTLYFEQIFDEDNLKDVVYKLNGEAEMFYRKRSIDYKITHKKGEPIENKNVLNKKKKSVFNYDLIKDKRFALDQFEFHVPITINFKSEGYLMDQAINESIKRCKENYIIGIDRGERNLIYIVVINEKGDIVEQMSLNSIKNKYDEQEYITNYHDLLNKKECDRNVARKNWDTIENIKELKEGYVSQVVHKICELVEKYDAIIVMEDLNFGFKNSRIKVEKQVYQKFEKMLIDKLNLYVNKTKKADECGGLRKAYQLTRPYEGNTKMAFQNGFIYYTAPWNTSKIDPTTGFVNLIRFSNYDTLEKKKNLFKNMDNISYNNKDNYFEFEINYDKFGSIDYKKTWTICSYGKRLFQYKNTIKNDKWETKEIDLTNEIITLFKKNNIDINSKSLKEDILVQNEKFLDELFFLFKLTLQMRNSNSETGEDYILSPIKNNNGIFFDSRKAGDKLPKDADANGAYNIARKGLMIINRIKEGQEKKLTVIKNDEWLKFAQENV